MLKYLLLLRMSSFFLAFFISAMSFGSNRASSIAEAMWHPMPPLKSLIDASSRRGSLHAWVLAARLEAQEVECQTSPGLAEEDG